MAPGLASVAAADVAALDSEAGRVVFLVDGDSAGDAIARKLAGEGVPQERIFHLKDSVTEECFEFEDLIEPSEYLDAVNAELQLWQSPAESIDISDIGPNYSSKAVESWAAARGLKPPDKPSVAQRLADTATERSIVSGQRVELLRSLHAQFKRVFGLDPT